MVRSCQFYQRCQMLQRRIVLHSPVKIIHKTAGVYIPWFLILMHNVFCLSSSPAAVVTTTTSTRHEAHLSGYDSFTHD